MCSYVQSNRELRGIWLEEEAAFSDGALEPWSLNVATANPVLI